jgi:hypothetical protein
MPVFFFLESKGRRLSSQNYVVDVSMPNPMATDFLTSVLDAVQREYDYIVIGYAL